jgi:hypothetical protein
MSNIQAQIDALTVSIQVLDNTLSNVTGNTLSNYNQLSRIVSQQGNIYNTVYFGLGNLSTGNLNFTGNLFQNGSPYIGSQWTTLNGNIYYSSGNVGIKNSTPNFELDVYGNINLSGNLFQNGSPYVASQWTTLNGNIYYTSGNVGIKKTTPEFDLDVNGDINLSGNLFQNGSPYIGSQWTTSGANIYYNVVNGNVGIGTTTPYYALDIGGSANVGANVYCMNMFVINDCLVQGGDFSIMNGNLTVYKRFNTFGESVLNGNLTVYNADFYNYGNSYIYNGLYLNKNGALYTNNDVAGQHAFYSFDTVNLMSTLYGGADDTNRVGYFQARGYGGGLPLLLNPNGGNVGIGIGNPRATLDVSGSVIISGICYSSGSGATYLNGNQLNAEYNTNATAELAINYSGYLGGSTQFRDTTFFNGKNTIIAKLVGSSGNLGLGTTSPLATLDISGNTRITGNVNIDNGLLWTDPVNNRVGINNTNPQFDLDVKGSANISGNVNVGNLSTTNILLNTLTFLNTTPFRIERGQISVPANTQFSGTFSSSFSSTPLVFISIVVNNTAAAIAYLKTTSTTGFTGDINNVSDGAYGAASVINWIAIGT